VIYPESIEICDAVFATVATDDADGAAALIWARGTPGYGPPLALVEWEESQFVPSLFTDLRDRLAEVAKKRRARAGSIGIWVEDHRLALLARMRGVDVHAIPEHLLGVQAWSGLWSSTAFFVREGLVAVADAARIRFESSAFAALTFRGGPRPPDDPTVPAWLYGIVLGLDEAASRPPEPAKVKVVA